MYNTPMNMEYLMNQGGTLLEAQFGSIDVEMLKSIGFT